MNPKPTSTPGDDNLPATKGDVRRSQEELATMVTNAFDGVATRAELKTLTNKVDGLTTKVDGLASKKDIERVLQQFKVVAENIHKDVAGANQDEISLIKDQQFPDHEDRIQDLEEHAKLPIGPRFEHIK